MFIPSAKSNWITYACMHDCSGVVAGTYYVTVSLEVAVKLYRESHPGTKASNFAALDGFMMERKARFCGPPDYLNVSLGKMVNDCAGSVHQAAKKLGVNDQGVARLVDGRNDDPPTHVLKRLGLFRVVRFFSEEVK